jgi:Ca2+-binding EF-hand superfamily protein
LDGDNPKHMTGKTSFIENLGKVIPSFFKTDISKISENAFRVFDIDHDWKINFLEVMDVYNIMAWTDPH